MKYSASLLAALLLMAITPQSNASAQAVPDGRWTGSILIQGTELQMNVDFDAHGQSATIDIPPQGAFGLPLSNVSLSADSVHFELPAGPGLAVFEATSISSDHISGRFTQAGMVGSFELAPSTEPEPVEVEHAPSVDVTADVDGGTLHGSLSVPSTGAEPRTLVILHAGSGPTDRNGNTQGLPRGNNSLLLLSDALFEAGVATLRYDKRGIGQSAGAAVDESDLRIATYVNDLAAWLDFARRDERFERIVLAGHSEGALIATLAAAEHPVDGLVLIAGAGRPAPAVLREQLQRNLPAALFSQAATIIDELEADRTVADPPQQLAALFRPSVQPYLISWFNAEPAASLADVECPVLIVQGTTDLQITIADAESLAAANPEARLVIIEGMNHVLKDVSGDLTAQMASYGDPNLPLNERLVEEIRSFVVGLR